MPEPLPSLVTVIDPVFRSGRYLAVGAITPGLLTVRWHVWDTAGSYVGFATDPGLISLVISRHEHERDR
ncbi:hypothetical protein [Streptomyces sp. UNOB3_S3]|uniref:hypothetical protein n=1 Tax=Streptomyces sp. UNOB3_S3 TaxID=2871682 RepID=UPI001E5B05E4|nr:hypothetical protein [Streptomyces sp. UNOB3_S3]MCC3775348.1 hypothetical protein [Streptomyces sp. UNOB3_S3]